MLWFLVTLIYSVVIEIYLLKIWLYESFTFCQHCDLLAEVQGASACWVKRSEQAIRQKTNLRKKNHYFLDKRRARINKPAAQAAGADPSRSISTSRQNLPIQKYCRNFGTKKKSTVATICIGKEIVCPLCRIFSSVLAALKKALQIQQQHQPKNLIHIAWPPPLTLIHISTFHNNFIKFVFQI